MSTIDDPDELGLVRLSRLTGKHSTFLCLAVFLMNIFQKDVKNVVKILNNTCY